MESKKNNPPEEPCHVCGDIGSKELIMNCYNCRQVREHTYCARVRLRSVPDMWFCQVCRSSTSVLQISNNEEISIPVPSGLMLPPHSCPNDNDSPVTNDASPSENHGQQFLAFPSPKRKRRSIRACSRKY